MCLILFAFQQDQQYPLVIAANRDEVYQRPTDPAHFWTDEPGLYAGRDLQAGGTWMGVSRNGRFAAVTNYRDNLAAPDEAISRGSLCQGFLSTDTHPEAYLHHIHQTRHRYAGFNLLVGDSSQLWYYSNRSGQIRGIEPGVHGLSNGLLNEDWPKVASGRLALSQQLVDGVESEAILDILLDKQPASDQQLPITGVTYEIEKMLSSRFIQSAEYGTRCSTVVRMDQQGRSDWLCQYFSADGSEGPATLTTITA